MVTLDKNEDDAPPFVAIVEAVAAGILSAHRPWRMRVIHVDNWFGPKWLFFNGKIGGHTGLRMTWTGELTMPPFVPSRILAVWSWEQIGRSRYVRTLSGAGLHISQPGSANLARTSSATAPGEALVWYSGNTAKSLRGSIMAYIPTGSAHSAWYVGLAANPAWHLVMTKGTSRDEFLRLASRDSSST